MNDHKETIFCIQQGSYIYKLTVFSTAYLTPMQSHARRTPREKLGKQIPKAVEMLAVISCGRKEAASVLFKSLTPGKLTAPQWQTTCPRICEQQILTLKD